MQFEVRPITDDEFAQFNAHISRAFLGDPHPEHLEFRRQIFERDRSLAAFDGDEIVGTTGIFTYEMTTPGGRLPTAGVTMVSVSATHRRQGVVTAIMRRQLEDVRAKGEPMAALWASESIIYGRFGYGLASQGYDWTLERSRSALEFTVPARGKCRFVTADQARESWPAIWEEVQRETPGMMPRSTGWWSVRIFSDVEQFRGGMSANRYVSYEVDGELKGYVRYRTKQDPNDDWLPNGTLSISELIATTDDAYTALIQHCLGVDLIATVSATHRPLDEPLYHMLADPRRLQRKVGDSLWLRMVDIPACLQGRTYAVDGKIVFDVADDFLPGVGGRFALEGGPNGAKCIATTEPANISLHVRDLAAVFLGGTRFSTLARAGRVSGEPEPLRRANLMFASDREPWCPEVF